MKIKMWQLLHINVTVFSNLWKRQKNSGGLLRKLSHWVGRSIMYWQTTRYIRNMRFITMSRFVCWNTKIVMYWLFNIYSFTEILWLPVFNFWQFYSKRHPNDSKFFSTYCFYTLIIFPKSFCTLLEHIFIIGQVIIKYSFFPIVAPFR